MSGKGVTPGAYTWHLPTLHHCHTHILGEHASFHVIPRLRWSSSGETLDRGPRIVYPYSYLRTRVARWTFLFVLVCLVHIYMERNGWANFATFLAPVVPWREFPRTDPGF